MTQNGMAALVRQQLAVDLNCAASDLCGDKDGFVFVACRDNPGRRPFPRRAQHFEMLSMGLSIVVSATPEVLSVVRPALAGKDRDEAFSMPFVYGHSLYYLPDLAALAPLPAPEAFSFELVERPEIPGLYRFEGFRNALQYDAAHPRPDILAAVARQGGRVVAVAGASQDCAAMWQIGMDVLADYRGCGVAAYLVNTLTLATIARGCIPYYGTASSNIASQRVAHRAGYLPAWVCAYHGRFVGLDTSPTS